MGGIGGGREKLKSLRSHYFAPIKTDSGANHCAFTEDDFPEHGNLGIYGYALLRRSYHLEDGVEGTKKEGELRYRCGAGVWTELQKEIRR